MYWKSFKCRVVIEGTPQDSIKKKTFHYIVYDNIKSLYNTTGTVVGSWVWHIPIGKGKVKGQGGKTFCRVDDACCGEKNLWTLISKPFKQKQYMHCSLQNPFSYQPRFGTDRMSRFRHEDVHAVKFSSDSRVRDFRMANPNRTLQWKTDHFSRA